MALDVGRLRRYAGNVISETQVDGFSFLYRGIPRPFLILLGLFLGVYAGYGAALLLGLPGDIGQVLLHALGLLLGIVLAITIMKLWPRLEVALPPWFRTELKAPALRRHHKVLAWAAMIALVLLSMVGVTALVFGAIMLMGLVGGVYILFRAESYILRGVSRARDRFPWLWAGGGWRAFVLLTAVFFILVAIVTAAGVLVGSNEVPGTHVVKLLPTLLVLIPAIALFLQTAVLGTFVILQLGRSWMSYRQRRGRAYGPRCRALLRTHPTTLACHLAGVNYATGSFFFLYAVLLVFQSVAEARAQGANVGIDVAGTLVPSGVLDYIALATFAFAWIALLLNLSGTAAKGGRRLLNRRVFASLSIFFLMVLFLQVIVANGNEFFISVAFRAMYMAGLALAPLLIFWQRWKAVAAMEAPGTGETISIPGPLPPPA
jgi:hypothetical protein